MLLRFWRAGYGVGKDPFGRINNRNIWPQAAFFSKDVSVAIRFSVLDIILSQGLSADR